MEWKGLSDKEVEQSRVQYGSNVIPDSEPTTFWQEFKETFGDPMIRILLVIAALMIVMFFFGYAEIYETVKKLNQALRQREIQWDQVGAEVGALEKMLEVLGIRLPKVMLSEDDKQVFAEWNAAKAAKDFVQADVKRAILIERGLM